MVVHDPEILGGREPVIRGTRVPVYDVAAAVSIGIPTSAILESYPSLTEEQVCLAALYAQHERPGDRPRRSAAENLPRGARVLSSGNVPHPKVSSTRNS
jgi:uncharacterized protein (DUF433 family)